MSLNFQGIGKPIAVIEGGKYNRKIVSVSDDLGDDELSKSFNKIQLSDGKFQQTIDPDTERSIIYITGASGSGKSYYTRNYLLQYHKHFKKNPIILFSAVNQDDSLEHKDLDIQRIIIGRNLIEQPIDVEDLANSCVVMDDIDVISDKKVREAVYNILNQILEIGRHSNISCVITNHLATNGKDTRRILNECHSVVYFPFSGSNVGLKRLLEDYLGLDKKTIKYAKTLKSRAVTVFKNYPQVIMTERNIWLPCNDD